MAADVAWVEDRADVADGEIVQDVDLADFDVDSTGEAGDEGTRDAIVRVGVPAHAHQPLSGQRSGRRLGQLVDVRGQFVAVEDAAQFDGSLGRVGQAHARTAAFAEDPFVGNLIVFSTSAQILRGDLLQLGPGVHPGGVRGARHRVRGLAAAAVAAPGQVLRGIAPGDDDLVPRHTQQLGGHAMAVAERSGAVVADT